jgi:asparagine synthase (glutamine-hydrolysing)
LVYGSEPAAILASGSVPAQPGLAAIGHYLALQYVPAPLSGFAGISKLHLGEYLVWQDGSVRRQRWWSMQHRASGKPVSEQECLDRLDELMSEATRLRLIAEVRVGAFLSGGIESSLVVSYMAEHGSDVRTFSIDFPHAQFSEGIYAREVAAVYGNRHEDLTVDPDIVPTIAATVQAAGEPFTDSSAMPTYLVYEMTRRRVTVALSATAGTRGSRGTFAIVLPLLATSSGPCPSWPASSPVHSAARPAMAGWPG